MRHYRNLQTKGWNRERRAGQAKRIRTYKPWLRSTGPRTVEGKSKASRNARKHGAYDADMKLYRRFLKANRIVLRAARQEIKRLKALHKTQQLLKRHEPKGDKTGTPGAPNRATQSRQHDNSLVF